MRWLVLILVIILLSLQASAQHQRFYNGLGIEAGIGYNTATWRAVGSVGPDTAYHRSQPWFRPAARISYEFKLIRLGANEMLWLKPFVGWYTFGGLSKTDPSGYKDVFIFNSIEAGICACLSLKGTWQIGITPKGQYAYNIVQKHRGTLSQPSTTWHTNDVSVMYKNRAISTGLVLRRKTGHLAIATEAWFGLTNMSALMLPVGKHIVTENNFRVLIGWVL